MSMTTCTPKSDHNKCTKQCNAASMPCLNIIMGGPDPDIQPNPCDFDKFVREQVSHHCCQLGYLMDMHSLEVTIPSEKQDAMIQLLCNTWGPHHHSFTLAEAAKLLGMLVHFHVPSLFLGHLFVHQSLPSHL